MEEGFRHEYKRYDVQPLDLEEIKYISELGSSPLCTYHYLKSNEKKLIAKLFKVSDMEKENIQHILKQQLYCTEIAQHPFLPLFYQVIEEKGRVMEVTEFIEGQTMYDAIREIGLLSTTDCQFYAASMIILL